MKIVNFVLVALFALFMASCEYEFVKPEPGPAPTDTISFANQVVPIWSNNGCTNCHQPGGIPDLDLTAANAYNSLNQTGVIDTANPDQSKIYTYPYPVTGEHAHHYGSETDAQTILQWIQQGAKNN